ncbi:unnamed protein product [Chondrus crispus]|uniref:Uncharacterized protein n=1 Tax=Chondrus crispus TaxID=2769 RepID=R7QMT3_CHOCR|nr:unnamed protein product [Chondrus crispus]CDF38695.1 unnamed protein product [Chondrus crispus]|eukprot:XP_005718600.1 unnamed protein product [Chondrus crispus]
MSKLDPARRVYKFTTAMQADHEVWSPVQLTVEESAIIAWQKHCESAF